MYCEICGGKIFGRGYRIVVEGSELTVCDKCRDLGVEAKNVKIRVAKRKVAPKPIMEDYEVVENFHEIIRKEREKRGWTQEELAKRIHEKVTLIKKLENKEITPEKDVIEKLERLFNISLRERVEDVKIESSKSLTPTLGDLAVIRRKKSS